MCLSFPPPLLSSPFFSSLAFGLHLYTLKGFESIIEYDAVVFDAERVAKRNVTHVYVTFVIKKKRDAYTATSVNIVIIIIIIITDPLFLLRVLKLRHEIISQSIDSKLQSIIIHAHAHARTHAHYCFASLFFFSSLSI